MFLWLLLVHAVDSPGRRALLITLLSSIVLMAVAGVLSLSMAHRAVPASSGPSRAIAALVLAPALRARAGSPRSTGHGAEPPSRRRSACGDRGRASALLVVAILGAGVFMIAPVAGTDRSLTFPAQLPQTDAVPVLGGLSNPSLGAVGPGRCRPSRASRSRAGRRSATSASRTGSTPRPGAGPTTRS